VNRVAALRFCFRRVLKRRFRPTRYHIPTTRTTEPRAC
jgi:hypothetical protein